MRRYKYLIIGGGMAADAATHGIREVDLDGEIVLVGEEQVAPYNRPPLSKMLWKGEPLHQIWRIPNKQGVDMRLGRKIQRLDPARKEATNDRGEVYAFGKCLLAIGGTPRQLPFGEDSIIYLRTVGDYRQLRILADVYERFAVISGGFIGMEIAASLSSHGREVTLAFPEGSLAERFFPPSLAEHISATYRCSGIKLHAGATATGLTAEDVRLILDVTDHGASVPRKLEVDAAVAGIGIRPNVDLARAADLAVDDGILVDRFLLTSPPDIYATGDVDRFFCPALGKPIRVEHEDNANSVGYDAERAMAGADAPYDYVLFFYSSLFELDYHAVGEIDARCQMVEDWIDPFTKGIVY